ncbi:hypothetical protein A1O1_00643 [Capronia coronata CBS 617.96]|uniref:Aminotransferase class V domain-containing protein n=1 Tax=Capronia coronata CBS 617.96 TaxID=1182541 RepID=W9Z1S1_9EURO|nr:uncharacterized protein A1O1_00643 [Capronia coronata CBS 617.96]EXJ95521.1 hypothetical protein A1O1_00643 [Capronia coronata CBS 617.96]
MVGLVVSDGKAAFTNVLFQSSSKYDVSRYRDLVPVVQKPGVTYLNASFQPPMNKVIREAIDIFADQAVSEVHPKPQWQATTEATRELLGKYLNVASDSLAFTRDTTEGLNLFQRSVKWVPGDNVVLLDVEHPNHAYGWLALQEQGLEVRMVDTTGQELYADASTFEPLVDDRTRAIGLSSVMFHSGQLNGVKDICDRFRTRNIHVLVDLTQHVGVMPIDLVDLGVSAAAFGCHKGLAAPTGLGVLYIEPETLPLLRPTPPIVGAGAISNLSSSLLASPDVQYHSTTRRYEHLNISLISVQALNAYLTFLLSDVGMANLEHHLRALGRTLALEMEKLGVKVVGSRSADRRAPHLYILDLLDSRWQAHFKEAGIMVSHYRLGVRVSFGFYNTTADVMSLVRVIEKGLVAGIPAC